MDREERRRNEGGKRDISDTDRAEEFTERERERQRGREREHRRWNGSGKSQLSFMGAPSQAAASLTPAVCQFLLEEINKTLLKMSKVERGSQVGAAPEHRVKSGSLLRIES